MESPFSLYAGTTEIDSECGASPTLWCSRSALFKATEATDWGIALGELYAQAEPSGCAYQGV
ncbi:hypothetical protein GCM10010981_32640 [Dyella nitratireducens]|uniref:Uncharacterized protein n=1 Tax=Dyella nitratireducens TaxID=1849580 RepID=A0ABQ1GCF0_9GAMM|nr:hypothetical protein GCM10010981_32640 [Dyella nitratireducens]GLQ40622.1 hypothetical protein GCM10007902_04710 [Dyella nitratireducens]